jgi:uncharacterized membrane protein HdeD (DUF308 family)
MTYANPNIESVSSMQRAIADGLRAHWGLYMFQGILAVTFGCLAVAYPVFSTVAVDIYIGWLFLIAGIIGLVAMFSARNVPGVLWALVTAALSLIAGVLLIWHPVEGAVSLTIVLTAFFIAEGVFQIAASLSYRGVIPGSWGWLLASGIADLFLAAVIIYGWPNTSAWTLGLLVGVNLITSGVALVFAAIAGRVVTDALAG